MRPALRYLARAWRLEPGGLTLAQTVVAFRLHGEQALAAGPLDRSRAARDAAGVHAAVRSPSRGPSSRPGRTRSSSR